MPGYQALQDSIGQVVESAWVYALAHSLPPKYIHAPIAAAIHKSVLLEIPVLATAGAALPAAQYPPTSCVHQLPFGSM